MEIKKQSGRIKTFYIIFGVISLLLMIYYLSDTIIHYTTPRQFPINSISRFPLTILIFPAEIFSFLFALYLVYNLLTADKVQNVKKGQVSADVAILIPAKNEPLEVIERTIKACKKIRWNKKVNIYLLDDSNKEEYIKESQMLGKKYSINIIRRDNNKGYKAGNINNAVKNHIKEEYFTIFDSDQAPREEYLEEMMPYFYDNNVGFVQAPQNFSNQNTPLERAARIGTNIFYRAQSLSKSNDGAMPFCGTNVIVRREVFLRVGGYSYYTATEDIDLGMRINSQGFRGQYVPMILVDGYSPPEWKAYASQQYRWSNGNLAILRENFFKILGGNFSLRYQVHMMFTLGWWLIGVVTLIYIIVPILSVTTGIGTHHTWLPTWLLTILFFHVVLGIGMIYASLKERVDGERIKIRDAILEYSLITNSMFIYIRAAFNALIMKKYVGFVTTNKQGNTTKITINHDKEKQKEKSDLWQIKWNLLLGLICLGLSCYTLYFAMISSDLQQFRTFVPVSIWLLFYSLIMMSSIIFVGKKEGEK